MHKSFLLKQYFIECQPRHKLLIWSMNKFSRLITVQSINATLELSDLYDGINNVKEGWTTPEE